MNEHEKIDRIFHITLAAIFAIFVVGIIAIYLKG